MYQNRKGIIEQLCVDVPYSAQEDASFSLIKKEQWRKKLVLDSTSQPQLRKGFRFNVSAFRFIVTTTVTLRIDSIFKIKFDVILFTNGTDIV